VPAAPIAWNGLVFIGNAGSDFKGGKGRMYALDAKTGAIVWEFYLVPKSEGDPVSGPQVTSPLDGSTWKSLPGMPISGGGTWTSTSIGIDPGKSFDIAKLDAAVRKAIEDAPAAAQKLMQWKIPTLARVANHWSMNTDTMGVYGNYGKGENSERYLGVRIPPAGLKPDYVGQARAFADKLAERLGCADRK
jgi:hypothetical protein